MASLILFAFTIVLTTGLVSANYCSYYDSFNDYQSFSCPQSFDSYDEDYCCGSGSSQYCCDYDTYYDTDSDSGGYVNVGAIVGGIFFAIFVLVIVTVIVICCCAAACPGYQRRHRGRVIPTGGAAVVVHSTQVSTIQRQTYPQGQMAPPPNYNGGQQGQFQPPPAYSGHPPPQPNNVYPPPATYPPPPTASDPAYPPKY